MAHNVFPKVKNIYVVPKWIGETDFFWYLRQTEAGVEYTRVDASTGEKQPAFDHQLVVTALGKLGLDSLEPNALVLSNLEFNEDQTQITFEILGISYQVNLKTGNGKIVEQPGYRRRLGISRWQIRHSYRSGEFVSPQHGNRQ